MFCSGRWRRVGPFGFDVDAWEKPIREAIDSRVLAAGRPEVEMSMTGAIEASPLGNAAFFGQVRKNWGWMLGLGILAIVLGTVGLGRLYAVTIVGVVFFGWLILIEGGIQVVHAFQCRGWKSVVWHGLIAVLHVIAGIVVISDPLLASSLLTIFLAASILAGGVVRIVLALQHRAAGGWLWPLVSGAVSVLLGLMIWAKWPYSGLFVIGLFIAVELILNGWAMVAIALAARASSGESDTPSPQPA